MFWYLEIEEDGHVQLSVCDVYYSEDHSSVSKWMFSLDILKYIYIFSLALS